MKAKFRQVFVYNLDIESGRSGAVLPSMYDLISVLERRRASGQSYMPIQSGDVHLMIGDIVIDASQQTAAVLIRQSDTHYADAVYSNFAAGTFRLHSKANGEGGETGAHIFISLVEERGIPNRYTCLVEKVNDLNIASIRRLINRILHDEYDQDAGSFSYPNPAGARTRTGAVKTERCLPRMEFDGRHPQI